MALVNRIHVPGFTTEDGKDLSSKQTKNYGQQIIAEAEALDQKARDGRRGRDGLDLGTKAL